MPAFERDNSIIAADISDLFFLIFGSVIQTLCMLDHWAAAARLQCFTRPKTDGTNLSGHKTRRENICAEISQRDMENPSNPLIFPPRVQQALDNSIWGLGPQIPSVGL